MKIVINTCFGGFSLSRKAVERMAQLQGRKCYAFKYDIKTYKYTPIKPGEDVFCVFYFDVKYPKSYKHEDWFKMTNTEKKKNNAGSI